MKFGIESEFVELEVLETIPDGVPCAGDVKFRVTLKLQEFSGSYSGVWLEVPAMEAFLSELEILEKESKGSAKICSMSSEEFILEVRLSDSLGHIEIEVQLHRHQYSGSTYWPIYLRGGFEVQPEIVSQLMTFLRTFLNKTQ